MTGGIHPFDDLKAYCDGELTLMRRLTVHLHLARCASCREEIRFMEQIGTDLRPDSGAATLDPALRERVLAEAALTPPSVRVPAPQRPRVTPLQIAATLGTVVVIGAIIGTPLISQRVDSLPASALVGQTVKRSELPLITAPSEPVAPALTDGSAVPVKPAAHTQTANTVNGTRVASSFNDTSGATSRPMNNLSSPRDAAGVVAKVASPVTKADVSPITHTTNSAVASDHVSTASRAAAQPMTAPQADEIAPATAMPAPTMQAPVAALPPAAPPAPAPPAPPAPSAASPMVNSFAKRDETFAATNGAVPVPKPAPVAGAAPNTGAVPFASLDSDSLRRVHKEAALTVQVADPEARSEEASQLARDAGGYVGSNTLSTDDSGLKSAELVLNVPEPQFDAFVARLAKMGNVTAKQITGDDITQKVSDADQAQQVLGDETQRAETRLQQLGKRSKWDDAEQARDLRIQLAQARARLVLLQKMAVLSTVTLDLTETPKPPAPAQSGFLPGLHGTTKQALQSLGTTVGVLLSLAIWILAYAPIWIPLALIGRWAYRRQYPSQDSAARL